MLVDSWKKMQSFFEFPPSAINCEKAVQVLMKMPNLKKVSVKNMWNIPSFPYFVDILNDDVVMMMRRVMTRHQVGEI